MSQIFPCLFHLFPSLVYVHFVFPSSGPVISPLLLLSLSFSDSLPLCESCSPLISGHTQAIDSFVSESMEALSNRPESMEEIGAASGIYTQILARKPEVRQTYTLAEFFLE